MAKEQKTASRLSLARASYAQGDRAGAAQAHTPAAIARAAAEEHGGAGSLYLGEMVLGLPKEPKADGGTWSESHRAKG